MLTYLSGGECVRERKAWRGPGTASRRGGQSQKPCTLYRSNLSAWLGATEGVQMLLDFICFWIYFTLFFKSRRSKSSLKRPKPPKDKKRKPSASPAPLPATPAPGAHPITPPAHSSQCGDLLTGGLSSQNRNRSARL